MPVSRALRRLLRVLEIEEEQSRLALESAQGELARLERLLKVARMRERSGRDLVVASASSGELTDRLAGIAETAAAQQRAIALELRIVNVQADVSTLREAFLSKRVERRQAETLITETEAKDAAVSGRRNQQSLDDWYLNRFHGSSSSEDQRS
jgi:flagellar export protein FliJ